LLHELRDAPTLLQIVWQATGNELAVQTQLRREYSDRLVRGAFALCELRRKGATKFSRAAEMWFDRQGLEQATSEPVALHKARRFSGDVLDLCSGIGGDCLALAQNGSVTAVDSNPVAGLRTNWNAEVYGVGSRVTIECRDVTAIDPRTALVHIDPDRRAQAGGRAVRVEDYVPGLDFLQKLARQGRGGAIKLGPASNFGGKFREVEIELVSLDGECKEATVWFGELRSEQSWRATVLPSGETIAAEPLEFAADLSPPLQYVFDPDPAVVRAGLVDAVAAKLGLRRLDAAEEYLTGAEPMQSGFVQAFEVLAELPNNASEIRKYFRTGEFGQVEIKCRHIPIEAESIRRRLPLSGSQSGVLIFARVAGKARALVCRRVASS
jgi:SAM-dependent methyltransferase